VANSNFQRDLRRALLCFLQPFQHLVGMAFRLHLLKDVLDLAVRADDECRPRHTHHLLAVHVLFLDHAVCVANDLVGVGDKGERQVEFIGKLFLGLNRVR